MTDEREHTPEHRVSSLGELPREIAPPRDLWPAIEAQLRAAPHRGGRRSGWRFGAAPFAAAAAMIAALAIGLWIGQTRVGGSGAPADPPLAAEPGETMPQLLQAALGSDPRYLEHREALLASLQERLAALPPDSREQVAESLATIRRSMQDIEAALGRDPGNVLLHEFLVNAYQDEMRVLTAVHEASNAGEEI